MILYRMWEGIKAFNYSVTSLSVSFPGGICSAFNTCSTSTRCQSVFVTARFPMGLFISFEIRFPLQHRQNINKCVGRNNIHGFNMLPVLMIRAAMEHILV